ncbi:methyltransferase domain-containing protein [Cypionkella sp.]|uniref:methyltransferase domain-containing protein n=1 Tax=Cypionkella sp. TaxID=2811411 RepID=UPI002ABCB632|nr:methyltransferase domain-containing protein [Cypionkella sp.]MDZ4393652.1 methyltransferase domain-containing protein [Cypionkella sp.]
MSASEKDWNPDTYARFRGLRLRPALDLLAQVGDLPEGEVVDLGCGEGGVAKALAARFSERRLLGVDSSQTMLAQARSLGIYARLDAVDIAVWRPETPPALIFSNAALQWVADHPKLLPRLAGYLAPGGVLAVQMPRQFKAASHRFLRDIAGSMFPDRFDFSRETSPCAKAGEYHALLSPLGAVEAWETEYIQRLEPVAAMHPVRAFTQATAMRPIAEKLSAAELATFCAAYEASLSAAYPLLPDGAALFPFKRVFFTLKV